jgi:hypothetical protein
VNRRAEVVAVGGAAIEEHVRLLAIEDELAAAVAARLNTELPKTAARGAEGAGSGPVSGAGQPLE